MKIKQRSPAFMSTKALVFAFIVVVSVLASFNLSPGSFNTELHQDRPVRQQLLRARDSDPVDSSAEVIEHQFISDAEQSAADAEDALASTEVVEAATDDTVEEDVAADDAALQEANDVLKSSESSSSDAIDADVGLGGSKDTALEDKYHVVVSVSDGVYTEWQVRVCYYWYKKIKAAHPNSAMGGFTRLLHSGYPDDWMDEIPTVVVDPLPPDLQTIANGYVVLNRPYAFKQWVETHLASIPERYVLMSEPDHLFLRPPPLWATPTRPAAFPFFYIEPLAPVNAEIIQKYNELKRPLKAFAPIGNSPVMISKEQLGPIVQKWVNLSLAIKQDEQADTQWGWVQEMYAWSIASAQLEGGAPKYSLRPEFMLQPPWDSSLKAENGKDAYIIHFTYGNDFNESGKFTPGKVGFWHWDKRDYTDKYPPMNFPLPPEGCTNEAVKHLVSAVNEAAAHLPGWAERSFNDVSEVEFAYGDEEEEEEEIPDEDPEGEVYEDENDVIEEGEGDSGWGEEDLAEDAR